MTKAAFTGRQKRPDEVSFKGMFQGGLRALLYLCLLIGVVVAVYLAAGGEIPDYQFPYDEPSLEMR